MTFFGPHFAYAALISGSKKGSKIGPGGHLWVIFEPNFKKNLDFGPLVNGGKKSKIVDFGAVFGPPFWGLFGMMEKS
jgi:hypothetical protein